MRRIVSVCNTRKRKGGEKRGIMGKKEIVYYI